MLTIPEFYENRDILITGASGFMGLLLVEKLLRSCPKVNKVYLLIRTKKGRTIQERIGDIKKLQVSYFEKFENPSTIHKNNTNFRFLI
jgi:fatty acyl-CoA reductase